MFDITRYTSLKNFEDWLAIFKKGNQNQELRIPIIIVGGKLDLEYKRAVSSEEAFKLAKENNLSSYIECSAKNGQNVEDIFIEIGCLMMKKAELLENTINNKNETTHF